MIVAQQIQAGGGLIAGIIGFLLLALLLGAVILWLAGRDAGGRRHTPARKGVKRSGGGGDCNCGNCSQPLEPKCVSARVAEPDNETVAIRLKRCSPCGSGPPITAEQLQMLVDDLETRQNQLAGEELRRVLTNLYSDQK